MEAVKARARATMDEIDRDPAVAARIEASRAFDDAAEAKTATRYRESRWESNGIPRRFWDMLHASHTGSGGPDATFAVEKVQQFLRRDDKASILVLAGGTGCGKTVAASVAVAFHPGKLVKAAEFVRIGMFPDSAGKETLRDFENAKVGVIDDMGAEPQDSKGYAYAALFDAFEGRYDAGAKTIITTNLTIDEFRARYGTGVGSRFWDRVRGDARWIDVPGKSLRSRAS